MSWSSFGRRASTATFLTLWLTGFSGCSRDSQTPPDPSGTDSSGFGVEATASQTLSARQVLENKWKALSKQVASGTGRAREKARRIRSFVVEAENIKSSEKLSRLPVLDQAKTALKRAENDFDLEWRGEFAGLEEVVMKILAEENADPISAEAEIDRFESNVLPTYRGLPIETELSKIVKDLRNKVLLFQQADFRYIDVTSRVDSMGDDYTRIVAVLAGFSPDFQETRYGPKVKARLDEAYAKYLEIDAAKTDVAALETKKWPMDLYTEWYTPDEGTIVETNKKERWLTLGPNPEGYEDAGTQGSYIAIGDGTWIDVWITTEVKVKDRDKTYLCWGWENHRSQIKMVRAPLEEFEIKDGEWYKFVIKVQTERGAKRFTVTADGVRGSFSSKVSWPGAGYLALQVMEEEATISVQNLEYKIITREKVEVEDEGEGEGDEGEGEGEDDGDEGDDDEDDGDEGDDDEDDGDEGDGEDDGDEGDGEDDA